MRALFAALLFALTAGPAAAEQNPALKRLTLRHDLLGWEAVGRVDTAGGYCTGVLVATELVLTAAHCVYDGETRIDPASITFRAGLRDGDAIAERGVARIVVHEEYHPAEDMSLTNIRFDAALLELAQAIPAGVASPFRADPPAQRGKDVSVVSYAQGRSDALSRQRVCTVLGADAELMAFDCDVYFGSSGAPVFDTSRSPARLVAIVSGGSRGPEGTVSLGMELPSLMSDLRRGLRTGRGVWSSDEAERAPLSERAAHRSAGHFVRP